MIKPIPNFPDYFADEQGNIYSSKKWNGSKKLRKLKPIKCKDYLSVTLFVQGKRHKRYIHRLILKTFVGPCPPRMESCHNDGIKHNNKLDNLRWDTHQNNSKDKIKHDAIPDQEGEKNHAAKLNGSQVRVIRWLLENTDMRHYQIAEVFDVHKGTISAINLKRNWSHV
jgi:hypothetical protein